MKRIAIIKLIILISFFGYSQDSIKIDTILLQKLNTQLVEIGDSIIINFKFILSCGIYVNTKWAKDNRLTRETIVRFIISKPNFGFQLSCFSWVDICWGAKSKNLRDAERLKEIIIINYEIESNRLIPSPNIDVNKQDICDCKDRRSAGEDYVKVKLVSLNNNE